MIQAIEYIRYISDRGGVVVLIVR